MNKRHGFHLVDPSPWPIYVSSSALLLTVGAVMYFQSYKSGQLFLFLGLALVITYLFAWFRDVVRESTFQGHHTRIVQNGLRMGVILFITSEVMFFFAFFWGFFHSSLAPTVELGSLWPPLGINVLSPWEVPLLNTAILLCSGVTVTWAHHAIVAGSRSQALTGLFLTISLGVIFTFLQAYEYLEASFNISDGVYGSCFYMATGFHGFHVLVGTIFLAVCLFRLYHHHFTRQHHLGFEAAAWYWHFVDVVWLFLFVVVYWWGNS